MRETLEKVEKRESVVLEKRGQAIFGILHRPISAINPPIAVIFHGFASSKHGSNRSYVSLSQSLAKAGIASFRFDFRGAGDSEGDLSELTLEDLFDDAKFVIDSLEKIEGIDSKRIALFGASLGGTIAIVTAHRSQRIKTMALWAPVASGEIWYSDFMKSHPECKVSEPTQLLSTFNGAKLSLPFREQFANMSTLEMLKELSPLPTLHMQGEKDSVNTIRHQEAFQRVCAPRGHVHFLKYPYEQHSLGLSPSLFSVIQESTIWFKKHL